MLLLLLALLVVLGTSNATSDTACAWRNGDGSGEEVGMPDQDSKEACVSACYAKKSSITDIDGVTYGANSLTRRKCFCERAMNGWMSAYKSCQLGTNNECNFRAGDGDSAKDSPQTTELTLAKQEPSKCIQSCIIKKRTDSAINGVTVGSNDGTNNTCFCERGMTGWTKAWKSCKLTPTAASVTALMMKSLKKLDEGEATTSTLETEWLTVQDQCKANGACREHYSEEVTNYEKAAAGFEASSAIAEGISAVLDPEKVSKFQRFAGFLGKLAPFLGAVGPILTLISKSGDSIELQYIKQVLNVLNGGFNRMEGRFNRIDTQLKDLENTIKQQHLTTQQTGYLDDIAFAKRRIDAYFVEGLTAIQRARKKDDLNTNLYDRTERAINSIKQMIDGDSEPCLCERACTFTGVDRRKVLALSTYFFNRMVQGSQYLIYIGYALDRPDMAPIESMLCSELRHIGEKFDACDNMIKTTSYLDQWKEDALEIIGDTGSNTGQEEALATALEEKLKTKYYWRQWMIVVWTYKENHSQKVKTCYTGQRGRSYELLPESKKNYNVMITSIEKDPSSLRAGSKSWALAPVATRRKRTPQANRAELVSPYVYLSTTAIYNKLPAPMRVCSKYPISGVIKAAEGVTFVMKAASELKSYHRTTNQQARSQPPTNYHLFAIGYDPLGTGYAAPPETLGNLG